MEDLTMKIKEVFKKNSKIVDKLTEAEKRLKRRNHKLQNFTNTHIDVAEFVRKLVLDYTYRFNTIYSRTGTHHAENGRNRSLGDLYRITIHYFPNLKFWEFIPLVYVEGGIRNDSLVLHISYCGTIKRKIYTRQSYLGRYWDAKWVTDEFNIRGEDMIDFAEELHKLKYVDKIVEDNTNCVVFE